MKLDYMRLVNYVDCASTLAEGLAQDIKKRKGRISSTTVVNLAKFIAASSAVQSLLDQVEVDKSSIN